MFCPWTSRRRDERGAAAVEFALIAPVICFLVYGIVSYGYMMSFRQAVSQGVSEGARAAAVAPGPMPADEKKTRAREAVNAGLDNYGVSCNDSGDVVKDGGVVGTCQISSPQTCTGSTQDAQCVVVTVSYSYRAHPLIPSVPGVGVVLPQTLTVKAESQVS